MVNASGLTLAKSVPVARLEAFHRVGLGVSPVWHVFCIDGAIAFTEDISAVGDLRLRLDLDALRDLGDGLAWAPADVWSQAGERDPACARGVLCAVQAGLEADGLQARVGHELEFVLVADATPPGPRGWVPYGVTGLLDSESFIRDLYDAFATAGLEIEQLHAEYGHQQFELSLPPERPVAAADCVVLARILVGRVARRHGARVSFSPVPFAGSVGNGAHQHLSLSRRDVPLFSAGQGPYGITGEGAAVIGGILRSLPEIQGILGGSVLSPARLEPGLWSGAHVGWGLENREAAVRFIRGGASSPHGANVEIKIVDPSANVYAASAAILAMAQHGIATGAHLPEEMSGDPAKLTDEQRAAAGIRLLSTRLPTVIDALEQSAQVRSLLGDALVDTIVATRRYEQAHYGTRAPEELAELFRLAWSS
jgi:glutamine synthetase